MHTRNLVAIGAIVLQTIHVAMPNELEDDERQLDILKRPPLLWTTAQKPPVEHSPAGLCGSPNRFFGTNLAVIFQDSPKDINIPESFSMIYNELAEDDCDSYSRQVVDVTTSSISEKMIHLVVEVACAGCPLETTLFSQEDRQGRQLNALTKAQTQLDALDDDGQRRLRGLESLSNHKHIIRPPIDISKFFGTQTTVDNSPGRDCACPADGPNRSPTTNEFVDAWNQEYPPITSISEVTPIECSGKNQLFDTVVHVTFNGDPDEIISPEKRALEQTFLDTYNSFGMDTTCDPFIRSVLHVRIAPDDNNGRRRLAKREFRYRFNIRGSCRRCGGRNRRIFSEAVGRRELQFTLSRSNGQEEDDLCFCAVGAEERGVQVPEFTTRYDDNIARLRNQGVIVHVDQVIGIEEEDPPTWSPTTSPSSAPTGPTDSPVPSPSPSMTPTEGF